MLAASASARPRRRSPPRAPSACGRSACGAPRGRRARHRGDSARARPRSRLAGRPGAAVGGDPVAELRSPARTKRPPVDFVSYHWSLPDAFDQQAHVTIPSVAWRRKPAMRLSAPAAARSRATCSPWKRAMPSSFSRRLARAVAAGDGGGAIGRAAGDLVHRHLRLAGVGQADDHHALVQQRGVERQDGAFPGRHAGWRCEANTLPTLPTSAPFSHSPPVWSRKLRICAAMLPKRVGVPKMIAS